eukprot:scaffold68154_cov42-Attheya_sp.AAC.2
MAHNNRQVPRRAVVWRGSAVVSLVESENNEVENKLEVMKRERRSTCSTQSPPPLSFVGINPPFP